MNRSAKQRVTCSRAGSRLFSGHLEALESRQLLAITLRVLPDLSAEIVNTDPVETVPIDGYQLDSSAGNLDPVGWRSIAEWVANDAGAVLTAIGPGGLSFGEASASPQTLAELNLAGAGQWAAGAAVSIGKPFRGMLQSDVPSIDFYFHRLGVTEAIPGSLELVADPSTPTASIAAVSPSLVVNPVDLLEIVFSEPVDGFETSDLKLYRDSDALLLSNAKLSSTDQTHWALTGIDALQERTGDYRLELAPVGSKIVDRQGFALLTGAAASWRAELDPPLARLQTILPRQTPVESVAIEFDRAVSGLDLADLGLTRDGATVALTDQQALASADGKFWTLSGLSSLTKAEGEYALTLRSTGSGIADQAGHLLARNSTTNWKLDLTSPTAEIDEVQADPLTRPIQTLSIVFSEPVDGLSLASFRLRMGNELVPLDGARLARTSSSGDTWALQRLSSVVGIGRSGEFSLELLADPAVKDLAGNPLAGGATRSWRQDLFQFTAYFTYPGDWDYNKPLDYLLVHFNASVGELDAASFSLTRNSGANLIGANQTVTKLDDKTWRLDNLRELTTPDAIYNLRIKANSPIRDPLGRKLDWQPHLDWYHDGTPPTASLQRNAVGSALVRFSEPVNYVDLSAFTLTRDGGPNLLTAEQTIVAPSSDPVGVTTAKITNLGPIIRDFGHYLLTLKGPGSRIVDYAGNPLAADAQVDWTMGLMATLDPVVPNPRPDAIDAATIRFNAPVSGFDLTDLALRLDGGPNLLTGSQTLTSPDGGRTWTLTGLQSVTSQPGNYSLLLAAANSGIQEATGHALASDASLAWTVDAAPSAAIDAINPAVRTSLSRIDLTLSEPLPGFGWNNLLLLRGGTPLEWTGRGLQLVTTDFLRWTVLGLRTLVAQDGEYELRVVPNGLTDVAGNLLVGASRSWRISTSPADYNADVNADGKVDLLDFAALKENFFVGTSRNQGDVDGDGDVDLYDFGLLKSQIALAAQAETSGVWAAAAQAVAQQNQPTGRNSAKAAACGTGAWDRDQQESDYPR
ncbi:MAG: dockerin type I domain-containing protein [Pirellulales bacterium]